MSASMNSKSIVECGVFGGILLLGGVSWSLFEAYVLGQHDPKWSPRTQLIVETQVNLVFSVEAAIGYGLTQWLLLRHMIATRIVSRVLKAAGIYFLTFVIWFRLIVSLWRILFESNAPSPVTGIWGALDDTIAFSGIFIVCPALGFLAAFIAGRLDRAEPVVQPDGSANGSQPSCSVTNRTAPGAGSRR